MVDRIKVLWVTDDTFAATGYGCVGRNVCSRLAKHGEFEVMPVGLQHINAPITINHDKPLFLGASPTEEEVKKAVDFAKGSYVIYPRGGHGDGYDVIFQYLMELKPDVVVTLRDIGLQAGYIPGINQARQSGWTGKWYQYVPIDSKDVAKDWRQIMLEADAVIAMSFWGQQIIKSKLGIDSILIPHGVDVEKFKPLPKEERGKILRGAPFSNCFIIGAVGRNQYRKMWNVLVKAFGEFAHDKNDVALVLHTDLNPVVGHDGWCFEYIGAKYGCIKKMAFTYPNLSPISRFWIDDAKMEEIYNSMDVFCFPTGGEGFGIPLLEAQSCGVPVITTAYTTGFELVQGHGELVQIEKVLDCPDWNKEEYEKLLTEDSEKAKEYLKKLEFRESYWEGQNGVTFAIPDYRDVVAKLEKLYKDKQLREEYSKGSREHALTYDYDKLIQLWVDLFKNRPSQRITQPVKEEKPITESTPISS